MSAGSSSSAPLSAASAWVDGSWLQVDQNGVRGSDTEALPFDLVRGTGEIDCRTRDEVAVIAAAQRVARIGW
jgi:hypothetical protein